MAAVLTQDVGEIWVPSFNRTIIGPATKGGKQPRYQGVISYTLRHIDDNGRVERGWSPALPQMETLEVQWKRSEFLRTLFPTLEEFADALARKMLIPGYAAQMLRSFSHNERIQNGGRMLAKQFWGLASSPQVATVNVPSFMALNNNASFTAGNYTYAHDGTDLSLGNGATNVAAGLTTNEYTTAGLARAAATVGAFADQSALDGVFTFTVTKTFTCTAGAVTVYGMGLFDAISTATCNLFMEGALTSATLQTNDTLAVTVNGSA